MDAKGESSIRNVIDSVTRKAAPHPQADVCGRRPKYRAGKKETAVKAYTVNQESRYFLVLLF